MLIAAPFRTSRTQGAILIYPRQDGIFTAEESALVAAIAGFGAVAVAHAELARTAHAQARELHQLLEISSELSSSGDLEHFLQAFVVRASDFLGFGRCFIALLEDDQFRVRYGVEKGESQRVDTSFPEGIATAPFAPKKFSGPMMPAVRRARISMSSRKYKVQQFLAVPLLGTSGQAARNVRRARSSRRYRHFAGGYSPRPRAVESGGGDAGGCQQSASFGAAPPARRGPIELAREIDGALRLPEFARRFVARAAELTGSRAGLLAVQQEGRWQVVAATSRQAIRESAARFRIHRR